MSNKKALLELKKLASSFTLLYVEDNVELFETTVPFFKRFFTDVRHASSTQEAWKFFQTKKFDVVITDFQMPSVYEMIEKIKENTPNIKIIITSEHNDVSNLHKAINLGVNDFLVKPIEIDDFSASLNAVLHKHLNEKNREIFNTQVNDIFNYQHNLVLMFNQDEIILANKNFLDFFNVSSLQEFFEKEKGFGKQLLEHHTFLYDTPETSWLDKAKENLDKLFHIKIKDTKEEIRHFIGKMQKIPDKKGRYVLSLDDISELELLKLFDKKSNEEDEIYKENRDLYKLLEVALKNQIKIEVHNFYKGLSITHEGLILKADKDQTIISTNFLQLKAMQYENRTILVSELFPRDIIYNRISKVDFENGRAGLSSGELSISNATHRKFVRVEPEAEDQTVTLFRNSRKFGDNINVLSISVNSANIFSMYIFSDLKVQEQIYVDMILNVNKKPFLIKTQAVITQIQKLRKGFELSLDFIEDGTKLNRPLMDYVAQRQMFLIREFKKMQYSADGKVHKTTISH